MSSVRHCCRRCDSLTNRKSVKLSCERPDQRFQLLSAVSTRCCNVNNLQLHQQDVVVVVFVCLTQPSNLTYKYFPSRRAWSQTHSLCCLYFEFDCLNLSVLLAEFVVFSRTFSRILYSFSRSSANMDISRKYGSARRFLKNPAQSLQCKEHNVFMWSVLYQLCRFVYVKSCSIHDVSCHSLWSSMWAVSLYTSYHHIFF